MTRTILALLLSPVALAQTPAFEAASVKPAAPGGRGGRTTASGDRYTYANTTLSNVLIRAYGLKAYRVDGPSWIFTERYDILAKAPDNTPKDPRSIRRAKVTWVTTWTTTAGFLRTTLWSNLPIL
jgi:hypothetical protein